LTPSLPPNFHPYEVDGPDHQRQHTGPVQQASETSAPTDGLLIHLDNGNIVAEPVGLGDRDRDQFSGDGRRIVIGDGAGVDGTGTGTGTGAGGGLGVGGSMAAMSDIAEELATPAIIEPDRQSLNLSQTQSRGEDEGKSNGQRSSPIEEETYADIVKHGDEYNGTDEEDDEDQGRSDGGLSRKNSNDRLLD
jgi:hypothetical protein